MSELTLKEGEFLVRLARRSIEYFMVTGKRLHENVDNEKLLQPRGVFVTLKKDNELRGCIGYPLPKLALWQSVVDSAVNAAVRDPRFKPLTSAELNDVTIEISVLTLPKEIKGERENFPSKIEIGKDGLVVEKGDFRGLLLPNVATEWKWTAKQFLDQVCVKANLLENAWMEQRTTVSKFQAQVFKEEKPKGHIVEE